MMMCAPIQTPIKSSKIGLNLLGNPLISDKAKSFEPNATLVQRKDINEGLIVVRVKPDQEPSPFIPGQYAELGIIEEVPSTNIDSAHHLGRLIRKAYSIASGPQELLPCSGSRQTIIPEHDTSLSSFCAAKVEPVPHNMSSYFSNAAPGSYEFYISLVLQGDLTPRLWRLQEGDRLWMNHKIKGKFTLDQVAPGKDLLLFSTGTGIAPFVSMIRTFKEAPPWNRAFVFHGVRYCEDLGYHEELSSTCKSYPNIFYLPAVSRSAGLSAWQGLHGRISQLFAQGEYERVLGERFQAENCQVMLSGNPDMINEMQDLLQQRGFRMHSKKSPGEIHVERYW